MKTVKVLVAAVILLGGWAGEGPCAEEKKGEEKRFTDGYIGQRKNELDGELQKKIDHITQEFAELQAFEARMKDDRTNFERKSTEEQKAFLDSLKPMKEDGRRVAWQEFQKKHEEARKKFLDEQKEKRAEFHRMREDHQPVFGGEIKSGEKKVKEEPKKSQSQERGPAPAVSPKP